MKEAEIYDYARHESFYLIVADETEEFAAALRYAARAARAGHAKIAILYVMELDYHWQWGKVEERIKQDQRHEAEKFLCEVAARVQQFCGLTPVLYIEEGKRSDVLVNVVKNNPQITKVILGADTRSGNPGPLVSYFTGKGLAQLPVPLTIVPDNIPPERIDELVRLD